MRSIRPPRIQFGLWAPGRTCATNLPTWGLPTRACQLNRDVLAGLGKPAEADLVHIALGCWAMPEREYQYFACTYLRKHVRIGSPSLLSTVRELITTKSWWDTVDTLAAHTVGPLVTAHPKLRSTMDEWIADDNMWVARTAILHQLRYKERTNAERLFRYCTAQAGHKDFFIRKAIGWGIAGIRIHRSGGGTGVRRQEPSGAVTAVGT